jgi:inosine-uridine nucleoside N-ribohydrolase
MRRVKLVFIVFILVCSNIFAQQAESRFRVIIDTDCAPDDLRAICLIFASNDFDVIAISTSDGLLSPEQGYKKIKAMLKHFGHEEIPVAYGKKSNKYNKFCNKLCLSVNWGDEQGIEIPEKPSAVELITKEIHNQKADIYLICFGPLTNISEVLKNENTHSKIKQILWYQGSPNTGYNVNSDLEAAKFVTECKTVDKVFFTTPSTKQNLFTTKFLNKISKIKNPYSDFIFVSHQNLGVQEKIKAKFYKFWDDLLPIYLLNPELFDTTKENNIIYASPKNKNFKNAYLQILNSKP